MHRTLIVSLVGVAASACALLAPAAGCGGSTASQHASDAGAGADAAASFDAWTSPDGSPASDAGPAGPDAGPGADATGCGLACPPPADATAWVPCPATPPAGGSSCTTQSQTCEYGSSWWLECNLTVQCLPGSAGWVWTVESDGGGCGWLDSGGACPATWAEATAVEAGPGMCPFVSCVYPEGFCGCGIGCGGGGAPRAPAPLDVQGFFACIPAMPGCPEPRPLSGTPCDVDAGAGCGYGFACGCGQNEQCLGGVWQASLAPACP